MQDYESFTDGLTGTPMFIDKQSGEVIAGVTVSVPEGSLFYTPKQQERYKQKQEGIAAKELRKSAIPFYFAKCTERLQLKPETITRLFYLMSFASHKENGCKLLLPNKKQMQRTDLADIMMLSTPTVSRFFNEVSPEYVKETDAGLVWNNSGYFYRGKGLAMSEDAAYMKIFCECVRKLYRGSKGNSHKYLGYIFQLLPYVNREYNILCWNPTETKRRKVDCMNLLDVCELVGFDKHNVERLFNALAKQQFDIDGCRDGYFRLLCKPNSRDFRTADILINPHLFYSGTQFEQIDFYFASDERKKKMLGCHKR